MVYNGRAENMVNYFTALGHPCPPLTNPCDFYGMLHLIVRLSVLRKTILNPEMSRVHVCSLMPV